MDGVDGCLMCVYVIRCVFECLFDWLWFENDFVCCVCDVIGCFVMSGFNGWVVWLIDLIDWLCVIVIVWCGYGVCGEIGDDECDDGGVEMWSDDVCGMMMWDDGDGVCDGGEWGGWKVVDWVVWICGDGIKFGVECGGEGIWYFGV